MSDNSFLEMEGLGDTYEPVVVAAGEYKVRILNADVKESKKTPGRMYINVFLEIVGADEAKDFNYMLLLPNMQLDVDESGKPDRKKINQYLNDVKKFAEAFRIPYNEKGVDLASARGKTAWAMIKVNPATDEFPESNTIKSFVNGQ